LSSITIQTTLAYFFSSVIKFKAKPAQYKRYINQIKACLKTIKWNDKVTITP
jgi:hypothetical protein